MCEVSTDVQYSVLEFVLSLKKYTLLLLGSGNNKCHIQLPEMILAYPFYEAY
jgi:hypothetical protein